MPRLKNSSYEIGGKLCSKCKSWKPVELFNKRKTSIDTYDNWCKECNCKSSTAYNRSVKGQEGQYRRYIERYGISVEEYKKLSEKQNHCCAICKQPEEHFSRLVIDHCHDTGKIRGLLCNLCNRGLGFLGDNLERVISAVEYLQK